MEFINVIHSQKKHIFSEKFSKYHIMQHQIMQYCGEIGNDNEGNKDTNDDVCG